MLRTTAYALAAVILQGAGLHAQDPQQGVQDASTTGDSVPLFASHDLLRLTLRAPFETLFKDRSDDAPDQPATLTYETPDGETVTLKLKVELRGKTRRRKRICNFPPLRLDFPKDSVAGTLFATQNKLKLVTQCQSGRKEYEQYVLLEYLIYRALNLLTDMSLQVRLAQITYEDTDGKRDTLTRYAFIIEDVRALAARTGWEVLEVPTIGPEFLDPDQLALVEVFQYMIGHTDWSAFKPEPGDDECCHNGKVIGSMQGPVFPVPYDFDYAGLINARYAEVAEQLRIRDVRTRVYRGICRDTQELLATLQLFNMKQYEIYDLFENQADLEDRQRRQAIEYLDDFFEIINDPRQIRNKLERRCRQA